jgi:hypothetical protein
VEVQVVFVLVDDSNVGIVVSRDANLPLHSPLAHLVKEQVWNLI